MIEIKKIHGTNRWAAWCELPNKPNWYHEIKFDFNDQLGKFLTVDMTDEEFLSLKYYDSKKLKDALVLVCSCGKPMADGVVEESTEAVRDSAYGTYYSAPRRKVSCPHCGTTWTDSVGHMNSPSVQAAIRREEVRRERSQDSSPNPFWGRDHD